MKHRLIRSLALGCAAFMLSATPFIAEEGKEEPKKQEKKGDTIPATPLVQPGEGAPTSFKVIGKIVNADGSAAKGATVAGSFTLTDGELKAGTRPIAPITVGDDGSFELDMNKAFLDRGMSLIAFSADGTTGGFAKATMNAEGTGPSDAYTITLEKVVKATAKVSAGETEADKIQPYGSALLTRDGVTLAMPTAVSSTGDLTLLLLAGDYNLTIATRNRELRSYMRHRMDLKVDGSKAEIDLGSIELKEGPLYVGVGKTAPELDVTHVRGTENTKLAGFKGKWVLLDFWGVW